MKNIKKIAAVTLCAALASTMAAGAAYQPQRVNIASCNSAGNQSLSQLLGQLGQRPQWSGSCSNTNTCNNNGSCGNVGGCTGGSCTNDDGIIGDDDIIGGGGNTGEPVPPMITPDMPGQLPAPGGPDASPTPPAPDAPETGESAYAAEVVRLVNVERAKQGLTALKTERGVQAAAQVRATEQAKSFSHTRPNGTSYSTALTEAGVTYRASGENIAYGQATPQAVVTSWMNSAGHRANIMNTTFTTIGVGAAEIGGQMYWAQLFIA